MTTWSFVLSIVYLLVVTALAVPLGHYIAQVFSERPFALRRWLGPIEKLIYRLSGVSPETEMDWIQYARAVLLLGAVSVVAVFAIQRTQLLLPLNPSQLPAVSSDSAINTSISFVTNTNWQGYAGESTMSHATQMVALTVQNFVSAATGIAVLIAFIRGLVGQESQTLGNFWVDLTRATLYVLIPLSLLLAIALVSQGVVQTFASSTSARLLEPAQRSDNQVVDEQTIEMGPVASQIAIKQLGTNGGGYFNANSAHPYENPTPLSNWLELIAILLVPAALCFAMGHLVNDSRQGWALYSAMLLIFVPLMWIAIAGEQSGNPSWDRLSVDQATTLTQSGGNMEGKEVRIGITESAMWAVATTAASNGSVNSMHDSYMPLSSLVEMWLMQLGEVVFGGVGSGLYGMLMFAIVAVFLAGLMVGRTPEYLGKKIGAFEMKMACLAILIPCSTVLLGTAVAVSCEPGRAGISNPGVHGFSEVLYAFSSASNNNGSAFAGLSANSVFYNIALGVSMLLGRYWVILPVLAISGALAAKKSVPVSSGTLPTHTPIFVCLLVATVIVVGALSFFPALALGPIVEQLQLTSVRME